MAYDNELAKLFKDRENEEGIGVITGTLTKGVPDIKISILNGNAYLTKDKLYCCNAILSHTQPLSKGDTVLLVPNVKENVWFIIDRVTKL